MYVILTHSETWQSRLIKLFLPKRWNYAGIVLQHYVIEAPKTEGGLIKTPIYTFLARHPNRHIVNIPHTEGYEQRAEVLVKQHNTMGSCFSTIAHIAGTFNPHTLDKLNATHFNLMGRPSAFK